MKTPDWAWASNVPLLQGLMEIYKPSFVLESGCGLYSTPIFDRDSVSYLGIENDPEWMKKVQKNHPTMEFRHHDLKGISIEKRYWQITSKEKFEIVKYYNDLIPFVKEQKGIKLLFVDGYTCVRGFALSVLYPYFDLVVYHDSQPRTSDIYGYDHLLANPAMKLNLTSPLAWTTVLLKESKDFKYLQQKINPYVVSFKKKWKIGTYKMDLEWVKR